jgi:hypothetical protein
VLAALRVRIRMPDRHASFALVFSTRRNCCLEIDNAMYGGSAYTRPVDTNERSQSGTFVLGMLAESDDLKTATRNMTACGSPRSLWGATAEV